MVLGWDTRGYVGMESYMVNVGKAWVSGLGGVGLDGGIYHL